MTEQQVQQIIDGLGEGITKLSETMGVALPHLWEVLVRQQYVEGIIILLLWIPTLFAAIGIYKLLKIGTSDDFDYAEALLTFVFSALVFLVIFSVILVGLSTSAIGKLMNPEYYAIKAVVEMVQGGRLQ
jgi:hypothetical protein